MKMIPCTPVVSAGGDDRRVLLWHMEKALHGRSKPVKLKGEHRSNIFCLAFDSSNTKVFSGGEFQTLWWGNVHVNKLGSSGADPHSAFFVPQEMTSR